MKLYDKITNMAQTYIARDAKDNRSVDMVDVFDVRFSNPAYVKVYSLKLASGKAVEISLNLAYDKTDSARFVDAYIRAWYHYERANLLNEHKVLSEIEQYDDNDKIAAAVVEARFDHIINAMNQFKSIEGIPHTVLCLVRADRGARAESFGMPDKISAVMDALKSVDNDAVSSGKVGALNKVRDALRELCPAVWVETEDGTIGKYWYNPNARLTMDVYRVAYEGMKRTKSGTIAAHIAKDSKVVSQVVYTLFHEIQRKEEEKRKEAPAPTPKKKATPKKATPKKEEAQTEPKPEAPAPAAENTKA